MKLIFFYLIIITVFFQSCYCYKNIDSNSTPLIEGKKYKFKANGKITKAIFIRSSDSTSIFEVNKNQLQIATNEINGIKKRKISVTKTIGFITSLLLVTSTIVILDGLSHISYYNGK